MHSCFSNINSPNSFTQTVIIFTYILQVTFSNPTWDIQSAYSLSCFTSVHHQISNYFFSLTGIGSCYMFAISSIDAKYESSG
jgi:hypothetical protein